ncbi:hypothetical protein DW1_1544 [Proteiniborus sp. DW1]|uniref:hypothetical protein n=1 Tax=Proteiniborus sp. DW1 TaxID=1889883 RepID=UPI00092DF70A|nr:hypothetical protein [Proteiniborus sp. DW1]SCG83115.1 hypothetical protein DW1_1544 [Proteiniborus sp. DW1]
MRKNSIILISVLLLFVFVHGYLYGSSYEKNQNGYKEIIEELLSNRTSIMNRALYGDEDINISFVDLEKVESGKLLEEDIESLLYARTNPTDYPFISNVEVLEVELLEWQDNIYKFKVLIQWEVIEIEEYKLDIEFFIHMKQEYGDFLLISLDPVI